MAVPVIESVSNAVYVQDVASLVITKPTGLTAGETMVAVIENASDDGFGVGTLSAPAGWTSVIATAVSQMQISVFTKTADSADVSASDFTFTNSDTVQSITVGSIFRLSTSPVVTSYLNGVDLGLGTDIAFADTQDTQFVDSLLLMVISGYKVTSGTNSLSTYVINGTNPTWTEQQDTQLTADRRHTFAIASAPLSDIRTITSFGATAASADFSFLGVLLVINESVGAQGTNATFAVSPLLSTQNGVAGTQGTSALLAVSPNLPTQSGKATSPTQWSNENKPSTVWTNTPKI